MVVVSGWVSGFWFMVVYGGWGWVVVVVVAMVVAVVAVVVGSDNRFVGSGEDEIENKK